MNKTLMIFLSAVLLLGAAAMTAQEAPQKSNVPAEDMPPGPPPMPRMKSPHDYFMEKLTPAERDEITKLIREKKFPELKTRMHELFMKYRPEEDKRVSALSGKYLAARTEEEKAQIRKELEAAIRVQFAKRMEFTKRRCGRTVENRRKTFEKAQGTLRTESEKIGGNHSDAPEMDVHSEIRTPETASAAGRKKRSPATGTF